MIDSRRVEFLYGDLAVDQSTIAKLIQVPTVALERYIQQNKLVRGKPTYGPYSPTIAAVLGRTLRVEVPSVEEVKTDEEWPKLRAFLRTEFLRLVTETRGPWNDVRAFLVELPHLTAAAEARLTKDRLEFLVGDLGMSTRDTAILLSAPSSRVLARIQDFKIHPGSSKHDDLNSDALAVLANRLGLSEWVLDYEALSRFDRYWSTWRKAVREGLLRLAAQGRLDLSVLDTFIANIPAIADERRQRMACMLAKVPSVNKPARSQAA
ncbi:MAG: hypothetical protein ACHREM_13235 [Polyangiales bacterium]